MKLFLNSELTNKAVKAIAEFDLIKAGDRIAVGLSGGKDSNFLLYVLRLLQLNFKIDFDLTAIHVEPGFKTTSLNKLSDFCQQLGVDLTVIETKIAEYINQTTDNSPCAKCSHFRKGAIINHLNQNNFNKVAFGHHLDDVVETFLLSLFYSGQLKTLQPNRYLDQNRVSIIRPLIYLREEEIKTAVKAKGIEVLASNCPYDKKTTRANIRNDFAKYFTDQLLFANLISAMRNNHNSELWPEEMDYNLLKTKMNNYWH